VVSAVTADAVALKVAVLAPAGTMTEAGTLRAVLLLESVTVTLLGAEALSRTVQTDVTAPVRLAGLQVSWATLSCAGMVITPPAVEVGRPTPATDALMALVSWIGRVAMDEAAGT
jgi:hypothetical protein